MTRMNREILWLLTLATLLLLAASFAHAQTAGQFAPPGPTTQRHFDDRGRYTGRTEMRDRTSLHFDDRGRLQGRTEYGRDGTVRRFDDRGRLLGTDRPARR